MECTDLRYTKNKPYIKGLNYVEVGDWTYGDITIVETAGVHNKLKIGKYCSIGKGFTINAATHDKDRITTYPFYNLPEFRQYSPKDEYEKKKNGDIIIGNAVWIAQNVTIIGGVTIGDGAVIASGSIVTHDVPPYTMVAGNPAVVKKYLFSDDEIQSLLNIKWWDWDNKLVIQRIPDLLTKDIKTFIKKYE